MAPLSDQDDWARLDALLDAALERPEAERARFLDEACKDDPQGRIHVAELLRLAEEPDPRLQPGGGLRGPVWEELAEEMEAEAQAPLAVGETLGRYVIRGLLGTGGMGRVYRALDPTLDREVAIKAVARDFRDDAASLRRFEREARLLATLNHPNIAAIYGFELIEGTPYLVLELVEGQTLRERLEDGPLPVPEALAVAVQIADALQEAHDKGIVHRDLKPANVKLGESGRVKILDFGIAKPVAVSSDGEDTPTAGANPTTLPGTLVGTAPYMSPEQARGLPVDTRSDVWALGCLLYEMLTGVRAFPGVSSSDVLAAVLRDEVDFSLLPPDTPAEMRRLLRRCLRKDPRDRLQDAGDARLELTEAAMEEPPAAPTRPGLRGRLLPFAAALAGAALATALALRIFSKAAPSEPGVVRLSLDLPAGVPLGDDYAAPFALSADGSKLAILSRRAPDPQEPSQLYVRAIDVKLAVVGRDGGAPVTLLERNTRVYPNVWTSDGRTLLYQERRPGMGWDLLAAEIDAAGQVTATRALVESPFHEANADLSPDGRFLAYESDELDNVFEVYVRPLHGGVKVRTTTTGARWPRFGAAGQLIYWYSFEGQLHQLDYRAERDRAVAGPGRPVFGGSAGVGPRRIMVRASYESYDLDVARQRFLVLENAAAPAPLLARPVVVLNWAHELRALSHP